MWTMMAVLVLACGGGGSAVKPDVRTVDGTQSFSGTYGYGQGTFQGSGDYNATVYGTRDRGYQDQVDVQIDGATGRIRLPRVTLPIVHGGAGGWFDLKNVQVTDREITANATVNFINKPTVHIDRVTGTISINGRNGNYSGQCRAINAAAERQF